MVQQPAMTGRFDTGSPITFPEEQDDPRATGVTNAGGGLWGFFKVTSLQFSTAYVKWSFYLWEIEAAFTFNTDPSLKPLCVFRE